MSNSNESWKDQQLKEDLFGKPETDEIAGAMLKYSKTNRRVLAIQAKYAPLISMLYQSTELPFLKDLVVNLEQYQASIIESPENNREDVIKVLKAGNQIDRSSDSKDQFMKRLV